MPILATAGFKPEDIDYVLCTHLYADHVGWNTRLVGGRWVPTFPNARYLFARREWEHWCEGRGFCQNRDVADVGGELMCRAMGGRGGR